VRSEHEQEAAARERGRRPFNLSTRAIAARIKIGHNAGMGLRLGSLLGWGIAIYAVMFLLWSAFVVYGFVEGAAPRIAGFLVLVATAVIAGKALRAHSWRDILPYSLSWGVLMVVFDAVMSVPLAGWQLYADWNVWFGYSIVVLAPLFALYPRFNRSSSFTA